jgi:drug/metabolite transporter (DMT)-like permease
VTEIAWLLALGAAFLMGLALVLTQLGLRWLSPSLGTLVSIPTSTALLWALAPFVYDGGWRTDAAAVFAAIGLLFPATVTLLTFEANRRMGPAVAGAVGNLAPLFAVGFAVVALADLPSPAQALGLIAIVAGVTLLTVERRRAVHPWPAWALALPLAAAALRGGIQPAVKIGLALWPNPYMAALVGYSVSSVVVLAIAAFRARGWPRGFDRRGVLWFAAVGLCNGTASTIMYAALGVAPVTVVAPLVATYPVATLVLSALLLRTPLSSHTAVGVAVTVAGLGLLLAA